VSTDKTKQSLYFPEEMLKEIQEQAIRQDRSMSWIVQRAWGIARSTVIRLPDSPETLPLRRDDD
jgi:uncharacterized small protein (TIGR04563 family)